MRKGLTFFLIFVIAIIAILSRTQNNQFKTGPDGQKIVENVKNSEKIDLNTFIKNYKSGAFDKIELEDSTTLKGYNLIEEKETKPSMILRESVLQKSFSIKETSKPSDTSLSELGFSLTGSTPINVNYTEKGWFQTVFLESFLPLLFFIVVLLLLFKFFGPKSGGFPFNTQTGKQANKETVKTKFDDVIGMEETKNEVEEVVDFLQNPEKYKKVGAKIPKGLLLYGPPGNGKTLLARAVAGEANVPFFTVSGSEFMEMLVGMGAAKVRDIFNKAKQAAPAVIYIDEIDAIGKKRGGGQTGGHQEQEQTLNQLLSELDGFDQDTKVIVMASTNRPDTLDPALLRPGRFDRKVFVTKPTLEERKQMLEYYTKNKKLADTVDLETIAKRTTGFVGADLENMVNEAAIKIARDRREQITMEDFEYALEKVLMGPEKKSRTLTEKEREIVTYHELGHAVTAHELPNADPVEKISIVSRGMALGLTWMQPEEDIHLYSKAKFLDDIVSVLGGRAAEEVFYGKENITTGASNDFEKATKTVSDMIMKYGMDEELGTIMYFDENNKEWTFFKPYSEKTAEKIDEKIRNTMDNAYKKSKEIIESKKETMDKMAQLLLEKEYLSKEEFNSIMDDPSKIDKMIEQAKEEKEKRAQEEEKIREKERKEKEERQNQQTDENKDGENEKGNKKKDKKQQLKDFLDKFLK